MNNYDLSDYKTIKAILSKHGFNFTKSLGQNFLTDPTVAPDMAECCGIDSDSGVLEIGPGIGVLTKELALRAGKVVSVELDASLLPVLSETLDGFENVRVVNADILKLDLKSLIKNEFDGMKVVVCANLPYYITSPVIMRLLESELPVSQITVMIQKEVANRLCAEPGTRDAGAITVFVNYYAEVQRLFEVGKGSFVPSPKVDSTVISLMIRDAPPVSVSDKEKFFAMVKAAFSMRRKTALNSISNGMGVSKEVVAAALEECGLPSDIRAEKMSMSELAELSQKL